MSKFITKGYIGTPHPHLMWHPPGNGKLKQEPVRDRLRVVLAPIDGSKEWAELHRRTLNWSGDDDSEWLKEFRLHLPCGECRRHWDGMVARTPPDWANYFAWTVDRHNEVNAKLGKPVMSIETARQTWAG